MFTAKVYASPDLTSKVLSYLTSYIYLASYFGIGLLPVAWLLLGVWIKSPWPLAGPLNLWSWAVSAAPEWMYHLLHRQTTVTVMVSATDQPVVFHTAIKTLWTGRWRVEGVVHSGARVERRGQERSEPEHICSLGLELDCCAMVEHAPENKHSAESTGLYNSAIHGANPQIVLFVTYWVASCFSNDEV